MLLALNGGIPMAAADLCLSVYQHRQSVGCNGSHPLCIYSAIHFCCPLFSMPYQLFNMSTSFFDIHIPLLAMYIPLPAICILLMRISCYSTLGINSKLGLDFDPCATLCYSTFAGFFLPSYQDGYASSSLMTEDCVGLAERSHLSNSITVERGSCVHEQCLSLYLR